MSNLNWKHWSEVQIASFLSLRDGETKLGEKVDFGNEEALKKSNADYVILLVPEDIGVRANHGVGGADSNYTSFMSAFLNIQSHPALTGEEVFMYGYLNPKWAEGYAEEQDAKRLRNLTSSLDEFLEKILQVIYDLGKIPVLVGGGHNNAYPLIKAASLSKKKAINVINIDAHADSRALEGRHSGNSFSYAKEYGYLSKYALLAWQEAYNHPGIIEKLKTDGDLLISYEDLFMRRKIGEAEALKKVGQFRDLGHYGLELDVDTIENALSSAMTPLGISAQQAYHWIYDLAGHKNLMYFHLPEGVSKRKDGQETVIIGKLLSFMVQAFIKGNLTIK